MIKKIGGRKFTYAIYLGTLGFILVLFRFVSGEACLQFFGFLFTAYIGGNVSQRWVEKKQTSENP